jgi:hypothetical protein
MQSMNDFSKRENRNAVTKDWSTRWHKFLGTSPDRDRVAIEILRQRYVEEMQGIGQLTIHARKMQYPNFVINFSRSRRTKVNMLSGFPKR